MTAGGQSFFVIRKGELLAEPSLAAAKQTGLVQRTTQYQFSIFQVNLSVIQLTIVRVKHLTVLELLTYKLHITNDSQTNDRLVVISTHASCTNRSRITKKMNNITIILAIICLVNLYHRFLFATVVINGNPLAQNRSLSESCSCKKDCNYKKKVTFHCYFN